MNVAQLSPQTADDGIYARVSTSDVRDNDGPTEPSGAKALETIW